MAKKTPKKATPNKTLPAKKTVNPALAVQPLIENAPAGSQAEYERLVPQVMKMAARDVRPMRIEVSLVLHNGQRGVDAVLPYADVISKELPKLSVSTIQDLPKVGQALAYSCGQLQRLAPAPKETKALIARAAQLRSLLLGAARVAVLAGLLAGAAIKKIEQGHGAIDIAGDCVALASLFQASADALRGKTPVTAAQVRESAEVGSQLLAVLKPASAARKDKNKDAAEMADKRDRLWTLYETTWEEQVWRAGAWVFKRDVDAQVPALHSRVVGKRAPKPAAASAPAK
jgi:hypothetical protein